MSCSISILIPAYNADSYIADTIASVKAQTFADFEVIIINDGSADATVEVAQTAIDNDSRFEIFDRHHAGIVDTRNFGLSQCNGKWIALIDADDLMHPQRLEVQYHFATRYPETAIFATQFLNFSSDQRAAIGQQSAEKLSLDGISISSVSQSELVTGDVVGQPTVLLNHAAIRNAGQYDSRYLYAEDYEYWLRLSRFGSVRLIVAQLTFRRVHSNNVSRRYAGTQVFSSSVAREMYLRQQKKELALVLADDFSDAPNKLPLSNKIVARYWGERLSSHVTMQGSGAGLLFWLGIFKIRPFAALSALRYALRNHRTGSVLKRWFDE